MALYSFQTNSTLYRNTYSSQSIPPPTPISPGSFYSTPLQHHGTHRNPPTPIHPTLPVGTPTSPTSLKRKSSDRSPLKENVFYNYTPTAPHARKKRKKGLSPMQKLESVLAHIKSMNWSYSDYIFWSSEWRNFDRSNAHSNAVERFLSGRCDHHPGEVIRNWYTCPDGRVGDNEEAKLQLWSTREPKYWHIKNVRASLSSFAAQTSISHAVLQAKDAVKVGSGLHVRISAKSNLGSIHNPMRTQWKDIGADTMERVGDIFRSREPFLYDFLSCVAAGEWKGCVIAVRKTRPIDATVIHSIAALNFCLNRRANWLPVARGILFFACSAPVDLFAYESRTGTMPAYSTVYNILRELGFDEAIATKLAGEDPTKWGKFVFDNVQNYLRQRDMRAGRENKMSVGLSCTFIEYPPGSFPPEAHDVDDRNARLAKNQRASLTTDFFIGLINHEHLETVGSLQWLERLFHQIPELAMYRGHVAMLYETQAAIDRVSPAPSKLHPLSTLGANENETSQLYAAILNYFSQAGQTKDKHLRRLWPFGGDGLTFQRMLELKQYLQHMDNDLLNLDLLLPLLEWWHTMWTDLCRIFETHWGEPLSRDPSTLGHSARKIGREDPSNLKKIDYYPGIQLAYHILDVRMLDCWRLAFNTSDIFQYFTDLKSRDKIPPIEDFIKMSRSLFRNYSSTRGIYHALYDAGLPSETSDWTKGVPVGSLWMGINDPTMEDIGVSFSKSSAKAAARKETKSKNKNKKQTRAEREAEEEKADLRKTGDRVLANSIAFMRDTLLSRECANAVASGDVGRVWEVLKMMLFTFAGSSHSKYTSYLLETITTLELESSHALRSSILRTMLINLSGKPGAFEPCDLVQEFFNRMLEFIVERKGKEFDHKFIQQVISRNLHRLSSVKKDSRTSVGLTQHAGSHTEPHMNPETRTLLNIYSHSEMHSRRLGRFVEERDVDDATRGMNKLRRGKVTKFARDSTRVRIKQDIERRVGALPTSSSLPTTATSSTSTTVEDTDSSEDESDQETSSESEPEDFNPDFCHTMGSMTVINGSFVARTLDLGLTLEEATAMLEAEFGEEKESENEESETDNEN